MQSRKVLQLVGVIVVAAGLVFGVTVVLQSLGRNKGGGSASASTKPDLLRIEELTGRDLPVDQYPAGEEDCTHDFWFENNSAGGREEVVVGVDVKKECTCSKLEIGLAPADWQSAFEADSWKDVPKEKRAAFLRDVYWQDLNKEGEGKGDTSFTVPPGRAGWIRVHWRAPPPSAGQADIKDFFAVLWARAGSTQGQDIQLVARGIFVNDVLLETKDGNDPGSYDCKYILTETLSQDAQPEITFAVWSSVMDSFDWQKYIHRQTDDPNSVWEEPVKLSKEELEEITKAKSDGRVAKCGYRVSFTMKNLPLGRFRQAFAVLSDPTFYVLVTGRVEGPVRVIVPERSKTPDSIVLDTFSGSKALTALYSQEIFLEPQANITLELDQKQTKVPDFLIIDGPTKLDDQRWKLTVRVSQDKLIPTGKFGEEGFGTYAVVLLVKQPGKPTKTMRIPVSGNVTQ